MAAQLRFAVKEFTFARKVLLLLVLGHVRSLPVVQDRVTCKDGYTGPIPVTRVDTTARLVNLRALFNTSNIDAYIIGTEDAHASEYVSEYDARRQFISGFTGSAGIAVVTRTKAALWTDGRYFLQAEDELDCNWIFMKTGEDGVPSTLAWIEDQLTSGQKYGASSFNSPLSRFLHDGKWLPEVDTLSKKNITLSLIDDELIDRIWTQNRPAIPAGPVQVQPLEFAGQSWSEKLRFVRGQLATVNASALVVTGLDETAWLFNLRGSDIPYNPFFISYAILEENKVRLYMRSSIEKLGNETLRTHLNTGTDGSCGGVTGECVEVKPYDTIKDDVTALGTAATKRVWLSLYCNFAIYKSIPKDKNYQAASPIALMKSIKNPIERQGMKNAHIRDAVALITFMERLEREVKAGIRWTEVSAAQELKKYRERQDYNRGLSFPSISGFGSNGAIIHYKPSEETDRQITTDGMYLLDSGGQYLDGTTDVTRTFHFGTPTDFEKEAYTRVLMGSIDLAMLIFPFRYLGSDIDAIARAPLWKAGLVYRHGTGHGIGAFLSVHEGPARISIGYRPNEEKLYDGMFFSDEPGYYEDGKFGIRLETIVEILYVNTTHRYKDTSFLGFNPVTLVPFEPKLIVTSMLNNDQIEWLNNYHKKVMEIVGKRLKEEGFMDAYNWVAERAMPNNISIAVCSKFSLFSILLTFLTSKVFV